MSYRARLCHFQFFEDPEKFLRNHEFLYVDALSIWKFTFKTTRENVADHNNFRLLTHCFHLFCHFCFDDRRLHNHHITRIVRHVRGTLRRQQKAGGTTWSNVLHSSIDFQQHLPLQVSKSTRLLVGSRELYVHERPGSRVYKWAATMTLPACSQNANARPTLQAPGVSK